VWVLRKESVALAVLVIILTAFGTLVSGGSLTWIPVSLVSGLILIFLLYRYGLLALAAALFFLHLYVFYPLTSDFRAWYATDFVIGAVVCVALAGFACYTSMAGQKIFGEKLLEDY
jgi:hypothetical protein